ncbi:MAG TPA: hypothetical protein VND19_22855 [Acetobacteraceae bacterium]|nr:hypothetical protein [Acetobacteraceae bacterium]
MSRRNSRYNSHYESQWPAYVPVAERRRKAELAMEKLRKKGVTVSPVKLDGRVIAATFWGKAWCDNLESYRDYENRLERGRTYVRNGSVVDLQIAPREVTATVSGSELYKVKVSIGEVARPHWKSICADCAGGIDSLVELLQGRFSKGVMERICRQGTGLFPKPSEIRFACSCPDHASMCKHVAAVLYGVGARLDAKPELLFRLRAVNENDLVADIGNVLPLSKRGPAAGKVLEADDMAALFGLDMGGAEQPAAGVPAVAPGAKVKRALRNAAPAGKPESAARKRESLGTKAVAGKLAPAKQAAPAGRIEIGRDARGAGRNAKVVAPSRGKLRSVAPQRVAPAAKVVAPKAAPAKPAVQPAAAPRGQGAVQASTQPGRSKPALPGQAAATKVLARRPARPTSRDGITPVP